MKLRRFLIFNALYRSDREVSEATANSFRCLVKSPYQEDGVQDFLNNVPLPTIQQWNMLVPHVF